MGSHLINMNYSVHKVFLLFGASLLVSSMVTLSTASKIYHERTIEIGVVVDKFLWQTMKEQSGGDDFTAEKNMKNMVNNLIKSTEKFTMHESISEKGGFRLVNNGDPIIWKTDSDGDQAKMTYDEGYVDVYNKFSTWIWHNDPKQKGDNDLMIFLSGAHHKLGLSLSPRQNVGVANVNTICDPERISTLMVTISLENKSSAFDGKLLAHELGHVLGAYHDNERADSIIDDNTFNTCEIGKYIMSPWTSGTEWSQCPRKYIDEFFNRREKKNGDYFKLYFNMENIENRNYCLYT